MEARQAAFVPRTPRNPSKPRSPRALPLAVLAVAAFLASASILPTAAADNDKSNGHPGGKEPSGQTKPTDDRRATRASDGEATPRKPGRIVEDSDGRYDGRYVGFAYDPQRCRLTDFRVQDSRIFDEISLPGECRPLASENAASSVQVASDVGSVSIHDAPNGLVNFQSTNGTLVFRMAPGINGVAEPGRIDLTIGNLSGSLRVASDAAPDVRDDRAVVTNTTGSFWIHPAGGGSVARSLIRDEIRNGVVAGEIDILQENGTTTDEVLPYEDVSIRAEAHPGDLHRIVVEGNVTGGRVFVVNLDPSLFRAHELGLRYWDVENDADPAASELVRAASLADVMSLRPGQPAKYWVVEDAAGLHLLLAVPHFSVHVFDVFPSPPTSGPNLGVGMLAGTLVVVLAAAGLRRPRAS